MKNDDKMKQKNIKKYENDTRIRKFQKILGLKINCSTKQQQNQ